jgi:hypothetical protein
LHLLGQPDAFLAGSIGGESRYVAPEQLEGQPHSFNADCWAVGVLAVDMAVGPPIALDRPLAAGGPQGC